MGEFILDLRKPQMRTSPMHAELTRYYSDMGLDVLERREFCLIASRSDNPIWSPYYSPDKSVLIALCGRIDYDSAQWDTTSDQKTGIACRTVYRDYVRYGIERLCQSLDGYYVIFIHDLQRRRLYLTNDRFGLFPCFRTGADENDLLLGSNPDLMQRVSGNRGSDDTVSIAEFIQTGRISFPFTYYKNIQSVEPGSLLVFDLEEGKPLRENQKKYFQLEFDLDNKISEEDFVDSISEALANSVRKKSEQVLGHTAIALSGGLDSRAVLCSVPDVRQTTAFFMYDLENREFGLAERVCREVGVKFLPLKRQQEHYGSQAHMGVRMCAGMANFGTNHYLAFRDAFSELGFTNILTGLYCDSMFKGLLLDKNTNRLTKTERLGEFNYEYGTERIHWFRTEYSRHVRDRLDAIFPSALRKDKTRVGRLTVEAKRIFPLLYISGVPDSIVPMKVMQFGFPFVDNALLDIYRKIPPEYKINLSLMSKVVMRVCGTRVATIANANTGCRPSAPRPIQIASRYLRTLQRRVFNHSHKQKGEGFATDDSWPNWNLYLQNSDLVKRIWDTKSPLFDELASEIMGQTNLKDSVGQYSDATLPLRLLTIKIWMEDK
jgi:asparagine synthetase B (glutamine-hydrolysing)